MRLCGVSRCVPGARVIRAMQSAMRSSLRLSVLCAWLQRERRGCCMWVSRGVLAGPRGRLERDSALQLWGRFGRRMWRRGVCIWVRWCVLVRDLTVAAEMLD